MKIKNELKHIVEVTNDSGIMTQFIIQPDDIVQINNIGLVFKKFNEVETFELKETDDFEEILAQTSVISEGLIEVNKRLDVAFGEGITKTAFENSHSLEMYYQFFEQLGEEMENTGHKIDEYTKKVRRSHRLNDRKKPNVL